MSDLVTLQLGDSLQALPQMPPASIDAIVTDPPYGLEFMGKDWDGADGFRRSLNAADVGRGNVVARQSARAPEYRAGHLFQTWCEAWARECLRVLKPGGHLLAFGGTRTYHRLACAIEDAGFEIRDQIGWLYGSGFPKSHNQDGEWEGWGTALKPAWEPIVVARKALDGTNAQNLARWGVGALNIDGCRVDTNGEKTGGSGNAKIGTATFGDFAGNGGNETSPLGRWPANVIHDGSDEVLDAFPHTVSGGGPAVGTARTKQNTYGEPTVSLTEPKGRNEGSAARFFYCAKASRADRNENVPPKPDGKPGNDHPTVKPTELMRYLCRLVTPHGGTVLDPFMGSGSTGRGAVLEGFNFIGIEKDAGYVAIAEARIAAAERTVSATKVAATADLFGGAA